MNNKTTVIKGNNPQRSWSLFDVKDISSGRAATQIAQVLMGKQNPSFSYHRDDGDFVVVINCSKIKITGKKLKQKIYYRHSGYAGNLKELTLQQLMEKDPRKVIYQAVRGMLPKNKLRKKRLTRLKIFVDDQHDYNEKFKDKSDAKK